MDRNILNMLDNDVVKRNLSHIEIMKYIRSQRSNGKFIGISDNEIMAYLNSKMHTNKFSSSVVSHGNSSFSSGITNISNNSSKKSNIDSSTSTVSDFISSDIDTSSGKNVNVYGKDNESFWNIPKEDLLKKVVNAFSEDVSSKKISISGEPVVSDAGRVQLNLHIDGNDNKKQSTWSHDFSIITSPNDKASLNRIVVVGIGDGGWNDAEVVGYDRGQIDKYLLDNPNGDINYTVMRLGGAYNTDEVYNYVPRVLENLHDEFLSEEGNQDFRYTFAGSSASASEIIKGAKSVLEYRESINSTSHTPMDFMLIDAADNGSRFVSTMRNETKVMSELVKTGSIVYAYEAQNTDIKKGINEIGKLTEDGMIIVGVENELGILHAYDGSYKASHEQQYSNGQMSKVVNGFDGANDESPSLISDKYGNSASNKYYLVLPKSEWDLKKGQSYYNQRKEITEKQLNSFSEYREIKGIQEEGKYLKDLIGYVESENAEKNGYINLSTGNSVNNDDILFSFQDIIDKTNDVVTEINDTAFKNNGFDYQFADNSTTDFPESLNRGNAFLYGITNTFLDKVNGDAQNIEIILNDFIDLDNKFGEKARSMMNSAFQDGSYFVTDNVVIKDATSYEIENPYFDIFDKKIQKEHAGKISVSDIATMFNGSSLTGKIGAGLQNEYDDASRMKSKIEEMINMPDTLVKGDVWDAEKERLKIFVEACSLRMEASQILESAYIEALRDVNNYISPDEYLDDGELPAKRAELAACKAVPHLRGTGQYVTLDNGEVEEIMEPNEPEWTNAQIRIKELQGPDGHGGEIAKLEGLAGVLNDANVKIQKAINEVNSKYNSFVNGISEVSIGNINISV